MLIQFINDGRQPDKVYTAVKNGEGATLPEGGWVIWDTSTDANGVLVRQPDTGKLHGFVGALHVSMASQSTKVYLCQSYGYDDDALVFQTDTTQAAGLELAVVAGQNYAQTVATTTASTGTATQQPLVGVLLESLATSSASAAAAAAVFIRAL